jgi:phosphatidylinositol alpha 1,6-mannosyltransferase
MPRVLFCTDSYPPQLNGVSVVTAGMVAGLLERGWECGVLAPAYPLTRRRILWAPDTAHRFELPSLPLPNYPDIRLAWPSGRNLRAAFDAFRPDVVHCATELTIGYAGLREATARALPVCTTYHTDFSRYCAAYGLPLLRPAVRAWIRRFHRGAARTLAPSRAALEDLAALDVRRTQVWCGGIDTDAFHPRHCSSALRQRHGLGRAFTFLHVGRLAREKNVELVLSAFDRARALLPDMALRLLIAGEGPREAALRSLAGVGVTFLGAADRTNELPALYASVDAFVTASTTETLGLVALEAMASGLPVVACSAGGIADYLEHARNGLAFGREDAEGCARAMVRLASEPSLRAELREGARDTAERWSARREYDRLDDLLRRLVTMRSRARVSSRALVFHPAR